MPTSDYHGDSRDKAQKIIAALNRLRAALIYKNPLEANDSTTTKTSHIFLPKIKSDEIEQMDLSTIVSILDAEISEWQTEIEPWNEQGMEFRGRRAGFASRISLRQALNIARYNFFNFLDGAWGPLWGKTNALKEVEEELNNLNSNN